MSLFSLNRPRTTPAAPSAPSAARRAGRSLLAFDHRIPPSHSQLPVPAESRRAPTATSGSPSTVANKIGEINPTTHAITEFPIPTANSVSRRDHGGPRRQPLVHRVQAQTKIGDDQPDDPCHHRVPHPHRQLQCQRGSRRAPTATSGSPSHGASQIGMINPTTHAITEFADPRPPDASPGIDHGGPRRQPLVHRGTAATRSVRSTRRPTPSPSSPSPPPASRAHRDHSGPDGNLWFTEINGESDRDDQPDDPRHHRVRHPYRQFRPRMGSRRAPTATSGSPRQSPARSG